MNSLKFIVRYELQKLYSKWCEEFNFDEVLKEVLEELKHRKV